MRPRRKYAVTLHTRSGARHRVVCRDFKITKNPDNSLSGITATGGSLPFYVRLDAVDTITVARSWRHWVLA
jgi:hypothetical protein